jgi:retron-type reverse transcriptase
MYFLNKHSFFSPNQYGFRPNMSTVDPLVKTSHFIHYNLNKKIKVLGIFLDFKKAFDSVNHELLIKKFDFCGIRGNALNLIKSFVSNRPQQVRIEGILSDINTNFFSVPQGTVLGPILFIIYINGLLNLNLSADIMYYADDTVVLLKNKDYNKLIQESNICLDLIKNWYDNNNL